MAIVFEGKSKSVNWLAIFSTAFIVLFVVFAVYYLFFAPTPIIEVVLPEPLKRVNQISDLQFVDPTPVLNSSEFNSLKTYVGSPSVGTLGRPNPFAPL